jgi:hypothetical protein
VAWALAAGGWLGVGNDPVYAKQNCFDPFPFPLVTDAQKKDMSCLAEELDALRKRVLAEHKFLTLTELYNVREKLRFGEFLDEREKVIHEAGHVGVINELHNKIDAAVAQAYGWPIDLPDEEILARVVALNKERADEEKKGIICWLRPDYQVARGKVRQAEEEQVEADLEAPEAQAPSLPKDDAELLAVLRAKMRSIGKPAEPRVIAAQFQDGTRGARRVERGLRLLAAAGVVRRSDAGWFLPIE